MLSLTKPQKHTYVEVCQRPSTSELSGVNFANRQAWRQLDWEGGGSEKGAEPKTHLRGSGQLHRAEGGENSARLERGNELEEERIKQSRVMQSEESRNIYQSILLSSPLISPVEPADKRACVHDWLNTWPITTAALSLWDTETS